MGLGEFADVPRGKAKHGTSQGVAWIRFDGRAKRCAYRRELGRPRQEDLRPLRLLAGGVLAHHPERVEKRKQFIFF